MVATRRGARTGLSEEPGMDDSSLSLRKKPLRRATAAKTAQPASKPRATRSKKADTEQEDAPLEVKAAVEEAGEPEPITTRATRSRRAETVEPEPEPSKPAQTTKSAAQPKRTTRTRAAKPTDTAPAAAKASTATSSKPALAARPARQTRAKTPAAQAPLSPKKITQVSKVRTRTTRAIPDEKLKVTPATRAASATHTTRTTRKRTVSDENAKLPELMPVQPVEQEVEAEEKVKVPKKAASPAKLATVKQDEDEEDEESRSSTKDTTPAASSAPEFAQSTAYAEDDLDTAGQSEEENNMEEEQKASDDELCGPKTPMRRSKKAESRYHSSAQKTVKRSDPDIPLHTPPKRYGANGATRPTPQTQKPHLQPAVPETATRPMTVGRAASRPFVFRKLEKEATPTPKDSPATVAEENPDQGTEAEYSEEEAEVGSVTHSEGSRHGDAADVETQDVENDEYDEDVEAVAVDPDETIVMDEEDECDGDETEMIDSPTVEPPVASYECEANTVDIDSPVAEPPVASYDPDDSMLDIDSPTVEPPVASYESDEDGSVIMHPVNDDSEMASDDEDASHIDATMFGLQTPKPQTIPWHNLREQTTRIPVDFDMHFANVRSPTHVEGDFNNDPVGDLQDMQLGKVDDTFSFDNEVDGMDQEPNMTLNDFIDVSALAEPTMQLDAVFWAQDEEVEPVHAGEDTEDTVIITRDEPLEPNDVPFEIEPQQADSDFIPLHPSPARAIREALKQLSPLRNPEKQIEAAHQPSDDAVEDIEDDSVPHYALPTLSSRRKSMSAIGNQTPARSASRPRTSDGASIARISQPFDQPWWSRSRRPSAVESAGTETPMRGRGASATTQTPTAGARAAPTLSTPNMAAMSDQRFPGRSDRFGDHARTVAAPSRFRSPARSPAKHPATIQKLPSGQLQRSPMRTPVMSRMTSKSAATPASARSPQRSMDSRANTESASLRSRTPTSTATQRPAKVRLPSSQESTVAVTPGSEAKEHATPQECYPRRSARQAYNEHASTVAAPARFRTPIQGKPKRPATAQRLASQETTHPSTPPLQMTPGAMPRESDSQRTPQVVASPIRAQPAVTPQERFPRLPAKRAYEEHATTVAAPSRFRSPAHASPKRPATSQKPVNLRKVALQSSFPSGSHTPVKTPLKPAAMTPSQVPMTPHPGAPLRGVVALVEVFTLDGSSASAPFISLLQRLGARTTKSWSERVTHVIFKDGSPTTLQRVRINNKEVSETGKGFMIHCVNSRWVSDCDDSGSRVDESNDAYAVDVTEVPRGGGRRRKSMEPSALINIGGNVVRDRKSSGGYGRNSIGRSAMKPNASGSRYSDEVPFTPGAKFHDLENDMDFDDDESEISTPDYLGAPDKLVQMTAPINRVRKLEVKKDEGKNRRLTFFNGGA